MPASRRAAAGAALFPLIVRSWRPGFRTAGLLSRPRTRSWLPLDGGTVLVVSPHPDDETVGCGGALLRHRHGGDRVVVVQVTDGGRSRAVGLPEEQMVARRAEEARVAAECLGVELEMLRLPEGAWVELDMIERTREWLTRLDPDLIYAPSPVDYHPEHLRVARGVAAALGAAAGPPVLVYELGVPLTATLTSVVAHVGGEEVRRRHALAAYATQAATLRTVTRLRAYNRAFWGARGEVECFWQLTASQYRAIVAAGDWSGRATPFRGIQPRPLGDPLCYLRGQKERRRLARVAAAAADQDPGA